MAGKASERFVWAVDTLEVRPADRLLARAAPAGHPRAVAERFQGARRSLRRNWAAHRRPPTSPGTSVRRSSRSTTRSRAGTVRVHDSLDRPVCDDGDRRLVDGTVDPRDDHSPADAAIALKQFTSVLDSRTREVVGLRYGENLLQREIAERVGCSQTHVSRILRDAMSSPQQHAAAEIA